jgi:hypothetical protein
VPRRKDAWAITLTGPEACEAGCLQHILKWPAERTLFIDREPGSAAIAEKRFPGCVALEGDLLDALAAIGNDKVAFIHLDLMGHCGPLAQAAVGALRGRLVPGAVVAFTYMRGREKRWPLHARWTPSRIWGGYMKRLKKACQREGNGDRTIRDIQRQAGTTFLFASLLGSPYDTGGEGRKRREYVSRKKRPWDAIKKPRPSVWPIGTMEYQTSSPMSCMALQWGLPYNKRRQKSVKQLWDHSAPVSDNEALPLVKRVATGCAKRGVPSDVVAEVMHVSKGRVRAWMAHWTMGHNFAGDRVMAMDTGGVVLKSKRMRYIRRDVWDPVMPDFGAVEGRLRSLAAALAKAHGVRSGKAPKTPLDYVRFNLGVEQMQKMQIEGCKPVRKRKGRYQVMAKPFVEADRKVRKYESGRFAGAVKEPKEWDE